VSSNTNADFQGSQESSPCRLRPPSSVHGGSHLLLARSVSGSISSQRSLLHTRGVQTEIFPVSSSRRQPALLTQLRAQEPIEPARAMVRSTIYCVLHRRIGHHRLRLGVGAAPRGNEIECRMAGVVRSSGNENTQGSQGVSPRLASECRGLARSHGLYQDNQTVCGVFHKMKSKCPALMSEIKDLVPWLHENKIHLDVVYIRSDANLVDSPLCQRDLDMWSLQQPTQQELLHLVHSTLGSTVCTDPFVCRKSAVTPRFATGESVVEGYTVTTVEHCRHSASFNDLILDWSPSVTLWITPSWHLLTQVLEKLRASRARGILIYPHWPLQT
jgi:hypothetical protein